MRLLQLVAIGLVLVACDKSDNPIASQPPSPAKAKPADDWAAVRRELGATPPAQPASTPVPSVRSLLSRLEARVAADPSDPGQWTLLAQSYTHVGRHGDAERAIEKALALGVDEASLRAQIALAGERR